MSHAVLRSLTSRGGRLVAQLIRLTARTWRLEVSGVEHLAAVRREGRGVVFSFWHGRMLELAIAHAGRGVGVLVSSHADGVMAERIVAPLGYVPIRGSTRTGAVAGVRAMLRHAAAGGDLALTPDAHSPQRVLPGAVALARMTGHALIPVAATAHPIHEVESWDRFEVPWPWARVKIRYGEALDVPADADGRMAEELRVELERRLRALHVELEQSAPGGRDAVVDAEQPAAVRR